MTFEETHTFDSNRSFLNTQLQAHQSLWAYYCGIVSFSSSFVLSDNLLPNHDRLILIQASHFCNVSAPFFCAFFLPHRVIWSTHVTLPCPSSVIVYFQGSASPRSASSGHTMGSDHLILLFNRECSSCVGFCLYFTVCQ